MRREATVSGGEGDIGQDQGSEGFTGWLYAWLRKTSR